jgi:hypothetical protein
MTTRSQAISRQLTLDETIQQAAQAAAEAAVKRALSQRLSPAEEYLDTQKSAAYLGLSAEYLEIARHRGSGGPPFTKLARVVRYKRSDLGRLDAQPARGHGGGVRCAA